MNQILESNLDLNYSPKYNTNSIAKKFKIILFSAISLILFFLILYFLLKYNSYKKEKISKNLASNFNIQNLYYNASNYSATKTSSASTLEAETFEPFVIGLLKISKIDLMYPILSTVSNELLELSPCRFYGPMPNEIGNLCIAGHNYINQKHFGKLSSLNTGDTIEIYDLNSNKIEYVIYKKLEVDANDVSCMSQDTNGAREVTLITCNSIKGTRIVIKAKENR